jgi:undecaprenyl-diphosphatase
MSLLEGLVLGVVQGIAEFLPISSSGHLVLAQQILGIVEPQLTFDVMVHFATILATLLYFRKEILRLSQRSIIFLFIASVPAGLVGIFFKNQVEELFASVSFVAFAFLVTGVINLIIDQFMQLTPRKKKMSKQGAFIVGLAQAAAVFPGISRSGSTIGAGILQGIEKEKAFSFSFLLSIPTVLGATGVQLLDADLASFQQSGMLAGFVTAFVVGYFSLKFFHRVVRNNRIELFGYYCLGLGGLVLLNSLL